MSAQLLHELPLQQALKTPALIAIEHQTTRISYAELAIQISTLGQALLTLDLAPGSRVAIYLPKVPEAVFSFFATSFAGLVMVPVNPTLKSPQVAHILTNSGATVLITHHSRLNTLRDALTHSDIQHVISTDEINLEGSDVEESDLEENNQEYRLWSWQSLLSRADYAGKMTDQSPNQLAALLYTSGSTGNPKGVMLNHHNMVLGAYSVCEYLQNTRSDKLLCVLPFSFDYGFSQLTTAFACGATVVLLEYLLPIDIVQAIAQYQITGLALVPPVWSQLAQLTWSEKQTRTLRYISNSGGAMPQDALSKLRHKLPETTPYLMYGLTEAFRSSYLCPNQLDARPISMGKAIPNVELFVVNEQGNECQPGEIGELVHSGPLVAQGYWQDPHQTKKKFKSFADQGICVWSGDLVKKDPEGYLYFVSRNDEMIKSSGYRISPCEIESQVLQIAGIINAAVTAAPHPALGQGIVLHIEGTIDEMTLRNKLRSLLPSYMQPGMVCTHRALPQNPNGKIDRSFLARQHQHVFMENDQLMEKQ